MGPEAGDGGGTVVYEGVPAGIKKCAASYTAKYL
jgi:excinuclease ABC subunit A